MIGGVMLMSLAGVLLTFLRLPGTWLIVAVGAGYGWLTDWQRISVGWVGLLAGIAILGELVELLASALIARGAGASRQASWGGMIGGIVGMFVFSLPLPIVGTLFGAIVGCFLGAALTEAHVRNRLQGSARVGVFAAIGFTVGIAAKLSLAIAMAGALTVKVCQPAG